MIDFYNKIFFQERSCLEIHTIADIHLKDQINISKKRTNQHNTQDIDDISIF